MKTNIILLWNPVLFARRLQTTVTQQLCTIQHKTGAGFYFIFYEKPAVICFLTSSNNYIFYS